MNLDCQLATPTSFPDKQLIALGQGDISGNFGCCPNPDLFPFKCSDCGRIMAICMETNDLFPDLQNHEHYVAVNSTDRARPAFQCPDCPHEFEYRFLYNTRYRVTRREMIDAGLGSFLAQRRHRDS
jgi:hypothetical protein